MTPAMIYQGDKMKLMEDAILVHTHKGIKLVKESEMEDPQKFLLGITAIPKGTILEASQVTIKGRGHVENAISFKVVDGTMHSSYNSFVLGTEKSDLEKSIVALQTKLSSLDSQSSLRAEIQFDIKNRQKRLDTLNKQKVKKGFTKLIKVSLTDIESWKVKLV